MIDLKIENFEQGNPEVAEKVLRSLPDWFAIENATKEYIFRSSSYPMFVALVDNEAVGFLSVKNHNPVSAEVYVMGVKPQYHRKAVGRKLLQATEDQLATKGIQYLQVKTLSEERECQFYRTTRLFYLASGFSPLEVFPNLWDESNPCLLMVKALRREIRS